MTHRCSRCVSLFAAAAIALTGCTDYVGDDLRSGNGARSGEIFLSAPVAQDEPPPPTPQPVDPVALDTGACFDDPDGSELIAFPRGQIVDQVPCGTPHRFELFARPDVATGPGEPWPDVAPAEERADLACRDAFEEFVGIPWAESTLDYVFLAPTDVRWASGDTTTACALFDLGLVPLVGSARNSAR